LHGRTARITTRVKGYSTAQMVEALKQDIRERLTLGCDPGPPEDLFGITVMPAEIKCLCPRRVKTAYKNPSDSQPFILHALRCIKFRQSLPTPYIEAFDRTLAVEKEGNRRKNVAQKERKADNELKTTGMRKNAIFQFLLASPAPVVPPEQYAPTQTAGPCVDVRLKRNRETRDGKEEADPKPAKTRRKKQTQKV
jgi:hypothetical protein